MRTHPHRSHNRRVTRPLAMLCMLAVLALLAGACSSDSNDSASDSLTDAAESREVAADIGEIEEMAAPDQAAAEEDFGLSGATSAAQAPAPTADGVDAPDLPPVDTTVGTAATGERIIKEGTVTVEVDPGQFDGAFGQVVSRAQALGGHVSGTSSSTDPEGLVTGQVTIRIPVRNFEDLLTVLADAGTVVDRNITSQDVSEEYTDLESRRRNLQAQERFYLGLLADAQTVNDAIAVQQQLEGIQQQIEQITGRLNLLADRSSFSTLTVRIHERGAEDRIVPLEDEGPSLASYVRTARDTLIGTVGALLVAATFILPFLVLGLIGWGLVVAVGRRRRAAREVAAAPPAATMAPTAPAAAPSATPDQGAEELADR